jgi:energy-coupling factor transporter ATP-binding protein EcfA2
MLRDLRISGFRGLREFAMSGLGRVNLLVGNNNCGKTTVLEAIALLSSPGNAAPLWQLQSRRGEFVESAARQVEIAQILHGRKLVLGGGFQVAGLGTEGPEVMSASLGRPDIVFKDLEDDDEEDDVGTPPAELREPLMLLLAWRDGRSAVQTIRLPIGHHGGVRERPTIVMRDGSSANPMKPMFLITTAGLGRDFVVSMFERIVLTPDEATVLQALRMIEPDIERIASIGTQAPRAQRGFRGGLAMMVAGQRVPVGSLGDGIWRLLGIALALVQTRGGVLLVDEIDTGLHYSVLVDMWRLVFETARSLDVQVFATTHSRDCYEALAAVAEPGRNEISLQRIERGKVNAVAFSEAEIRQAAERGLEVR